VPQVNQSARRVAHALAGRSHAQAAVQSVVPTQ
jgi:hypothetical protein